MMPPNAHVHAACGNGGTPMNDPLNEKPPAMGMYGGGLPGECSSTGSGFPLNNTTNGCLDIMLEMRRKRRLKRTAW